MDVERITRINNLALDLMRQGLATDREDAIIQAEKAYRDRDQGVYSAIRETMQGVKDMKSSTESGAKVDQTPDISSDKVKDILEKNTQFMVKTIKEFQEKIAVLEKEMGALRNQMSYQKPSMSTVAAPSAPRPTHGEITSSPENATIKRGEDPPATSHPRSGNYKDADVSIEKFFYMGHK